MSIIKNSNQDKLNMTIDSDGLLDNYSKATTIKSPSRTEISFSSSTYSVPLLGDVHYDRPPIDVFHSEFKQKHADDGLFDSYQKEFEAFSSMWGDLGQSAALIEASGKIRRPDAAFALQLGDLIEGDCESSAVHAKMLAEALALMKRTYGDIPFLTLAGNHDIRQGEHRQGEYENYRKDICHWHSSELGCTIDDLTFSFCNGPDLWIIADYNRPNIPLIEMLLSEHKDARYTIFCTHGAVLTNGNRSARRWFFLGNPQYNTITGKKLSQTELDAELPAWNAARRQIRRMLAERDAIVLSGHSHLLELRDWFGDGGRITELVMNSVTRTVQGKDIAGAPVVIGDKPTDFGICRAKTKIGSDASIDSLYAEYESGMQRYYTANCAGHAELLFSNDGVKVNYYALDSLTPCETFVLR